MTTIHDEPALGPGPPGGAPPRPVVVRPPTADGGRPRLPHFPALDGLRGLAVAAVLAYHGGFSWMRGGFLGVSTFFTLSGFLITALALGEHGARHRVDLKAFWLRRVRRLLPASLACMVLVLAFGALAADALQRERLAGDVIAALANLANWRFIVAGQSYEGLFAAPSPLLHYWSLAIEEQFYLLYPLLLAGLVAGTARARRAGTTSTGVGRRSRFGPQAPSFRRTLGAVLGGLSAASLAVTLFAGFDHDRIYLGTDTRAAELLLGGVLAVVLSDGRITARLARPGRARAVAAVAGADALAICVVLWVVTAQSSGWLYEGGFVVYAGLSCLVVTGAILPVGVVRSVLGLAPLRHLGRISYGVYLYHWPIFLWLRQQTDLALWPRFLLGVVLTLALAEASYRWLEMPVRRGEPLLSLRPGRLAPLAAALVVVGALAVSATAPPPLIDFDRSENELLALGAAAPATTTSSTIDPVALVPPSPRVAFFGDSTALQTGLGVANHLTRTGTGIPVGGSSPLGCTLVRSVAHRDLDGNIADDDDACAWDAVYPALLATTAPSVAVVQAGVWDVGDHRLPGDDAWRGPGDPVYDSFTRAEMARVVDTLSAEGALVVWLTGPPVREVPDPDDAARRMARYNELVRELPAARPGKVEVVDLAGWVARLPAGEDERLRPDGTHFSNATSDEVADGWLAEEIVTRYRDWWTARKRVELETGGDPVQVLVTGDVMATELAGGLARWADRAGTLGVQIAGRPLCGIADGALRIGYNGPEWVPAECGGWEQQVERALVQQDPQVLVASFGLWDLTDRARPEWGGFRGPGDPAFDADLRDALARVTDAMHRTGARVVWLTVPAVLPWEGPEPAEGPNVITSTDDPARADRVNDLIREVAAERDFTEVVDLAGFVTGLEGPGGPGRGVVPGGRLSVSGADAVAEWLAPGLVAVGRATRSTSD
jgi:peptidoglycan/LPS O-acetylase OafA/YrhL/lysophospholipase L1-like esterase